MQHDHTLESLIILSTQFEIKIPLVKLSFASKAGLKRIPKKRPAESGGWAGRGGQTDGCINLAAALESIQ